MQWKDKLLNIFDKYGFDYNRVHINWDLESIISEISSMLMQSENNVTNSRLMMAEIWSLSKSIEVEAIFNDSKFQDRLVDILKDNNFMIEGTYIKYNKFLPCSVIQTRNGIVILNDGQIKTIQEMGYGIYNFKIEIGWNIKDIFCEGNHPNLNKNSGCFCLDPTILDSELNMKNLLVAKEMMTQFNLRSYFITKEEYDTIMEVIS